MFGKWSERRRREKEDEEKQDKILANKSLEMVNQEIEYRAVSMTKKPCPFQGDGTCKRECVHFQEGWAYLRNNDGMFFDEDTWYIVREFPGCRLWGNQQIKNTDF